MINMNELNLLEKGVQKRLTIKGTASLFQAYKVPLSSLKYNIKNDRIATFVTQYLAEEGKLPNDTEDLNQVIEGFIENSNLGAFKTTKKNIMDNGQNEAAVVLSNGIVIDGNRRFTALRQLARETGKAEFEYIEAVILNVDFYDDKDIKRLELNLQHAIEAKVDYNPIERLVGIYRDLVEEGHQFSPEEYAVETQMKLSKVKSEISVAKLLVEYLEFIKEPMKFHIARQQKIDGPLREIYKILNSKKLDDFDKDDVKEYLFANLLTIDSGDVTRIIRDLRPILENKETRDAILEEADDLIDDIEEELDSNIGSDGINIKKTTRENLRSVSDYYIDERRVADAQYAPVDKLRLVNDHMDSIDEAVLNRLPKDMQEKFQEYLDDLEEKIESFRAEFDAN